jgi:uncharacterized tellurite resistance protein B-like protein
METGATPARQTASRDTRVIDFLRRFVAAAENGTPTPEDARMAVAAVLVMAARADVDYADAERVIIDEVLMKRYGLSREEAVVLRKQGEEAEGEAIDLYQFTRAIRTAIPHEDRMSILEALWRVVLADAKRDPHEDSLMRQITDRLGLAPMDSARARQKVAG